MKAVRTRPTKRPRKQVSAERQLQIETIAGQVWSLANALTNFGRGLNWKERPTRALVAGVDDLAQVLVEKSFTLLALLRDGAS